MGIAEQRKAAFDQALASTRIEGHEPTPEFLADVDRVIAGDMTDDEMAAESLRRARELDAKLKQGANGV